MKTQIIEITPITPEQNRKLKIRAMNAQAAILKNIYPAREYTLWFVQDYPKFNTPELKVKVRQVANGKVADEEITTKLETLADKLKNS